jgi:hypothetical protein
MKLLAISYILCYKCVMFCSNGVRFKLTIMIQNIITYNGKVYGKVGINGADLSSHYKLS